MKLPPGAEPLKVRALRLLWSRMTGRSPGFASVCLIATVWLVAGTFAPALGAGEPMKVAIGRPVVVAGGATYVVRVLAAGAPIFVIAPQTTHSAFLEIDGTVVQAAGAASPIAWQPLGHAATALRLSGLSPRDRAVVRVVGGGGELVVVSDVSLFAQAAHTGLLTGVFFTFLLLIALYHAFTPAASGDKTNLWYAAWALIIFAMTAVRDGFAGSTGPVRLLVPVFAVLLAACAVGFTASFLRLRREAPRLFWIAIVANVIALATPPVVMSIIHRQEEWLFSGAFMAAIVPLVVAALWRRRAGFTPATALAAGLCLNFVTLGLQIALGIAGVAPGWLIHWGMEIATMVNLTALSVALLLRRRYVHVEIEGLEADLSRSLFDANHDPLTGLLNRRGFDDWLRRAGSTVSTVFFIDLDGFKAINDRGGHALGDDVLRIVGRIIRHAVRASDAVARVGGDEFVIAFAGDLTELQAKDMRRRIATTIGELEPLGARDQTRIGASVGIGSLGPGTTVHDGLRAADADAYRIKSGHYAAKRGLQSDG